MKKYVPGLDLLRVLAILAVVMIHTTTRIIEQHSFGFNWVLFLNQITRFAVPIFFYVSGYAVSLHYTGIFTFYKKRFIKVVLPYIFWSILYLIYIYPHPLPELPHYLRYGEASYQLYFIPTLLLFYLFFPALRLFNRNFLIPLFILQLAFLFIDYYIHPLPYSYPKSVFYLNFFAFIYGICHTQLNLPKKLLFYLVPIMALFVFYEGYSNYLHTHNYLAYYSQWRPSIMIYSLLVINLFSQINISLPFLKKLSELSFFVFFVHVAVLELVSPYLLNFPVLLLPSVPILSFLLAYLASKVLYLSKLTG